MPEAQPPRPEPHTPRGHTLAELLILLVLLGIALALAAPATGRARDHFAARAARDATASALARTRMVAIGTGSARLVVRLGEGTVAVRARGTDIPPLRLADEYGVRVRSTGTGDSVAVEYDALGLGRVASRTLIFERGDARAGLSVAAFGRVRRW